MTDFGFAQYFSEEQKLEEVLGSPLYMPPEIINHQKYDSKVDIWSACIVIFIMLYGRPPFYSDNKDEVFR